MSKTLFHTSQIKQLENNPNVRKASERSIQYQAEFKIKAVQENLKGKGPLQIFMENGFDLEMTGKEKAKSSLKRWRKTYQQFGEDGFYTERRGKKSTGRPRKIKETADQKLKKAEARIAFLEAELEFLKKLDELERQAMKKKR
jgi:transposase